MTSPSEVQDRAASDGPQQHQSMSQQAESSTLLPTADTSPKDQLPNAFTTSSSFPARDFVPGQNQPANYVQATPITTADQLASESNDIQAFVHRGSVASIKDDPFFRNYQSPQSLAWELKSYSSMPSGDPAYMHDTSNLADKRTTAASRTGPNSRTGADSINVAVIGSSGVGKSTLIQRALGLRSLPTTFTSGLVPVENNVYSVTLIEIGFESLDINLDQRVKWPKHIKNQTVPRVDGALVLYDVMNRESIAGLPQVLKALVYSALPTVLVSCKCDNPADTRQIDPESIEAACLTEVQTAKVASNVPETARLCLGHIVRVISANRSGKNPPETLTSRRRAASTTLENSNDGRPSSQHSKHSRASSECSMLKGFPSPPPPGSRAINPFSRQTVSGRAGINSYSFSQATHSTRNETVPETSDSETDSNIPPERKTKVSNTKIRANSFLDVEESDTDSVYRYSDDIPILQRDDCSLTSRPAKFAGSTFDELVDRLLREHMSKADNNFSNIFLCLYRKFATPGELLSAILGHLDNVAKDTSMHYLTRVSTQLRIISILAKWVSSYPGDFASLQTSRRLDAFIEQLSTDPAFAAAAQEMRTERQAHVVEDDDTGWARTDVDVEAGMETAENLFVAPSVQSKVKLDNNAPPLAEKSEKRERRTSEALSVSSADARPAFGSVPPLPISHTVEEYEAEAATLVPTSTLPLTKFRYNICMDIADDDFAGEMTRIDWIMFSSIRVRDLVRHVSLPLEQKEKCKSLANVNRMIDHFNHIAKWVSNMVLMRDKPKHRALMLEKFMRIALKLRQLNNYNGLAAVIAGINGSAVHRLAHTRALVPTECQKRFMRLELLMGTQKSHFAYRLAWENSSLPRIPFIPLHRRDLVSAEEGSRTFTGPTSDYINWKKFEVLGEIILPIMKSQGTPYHNLEKHDTARELIFDCRMPVDEEEIYQRSLQLESNSSSMVDTGKKKFPWFQK